MPTWLIVTAAAAAAAAVFCERHRSATQAAVQESTQLREALNAAIQRKDEFVSLLSTCVCNGAASSFHAASHCCDRVLHGGVAICFCFDLTRVCCDVT